MHWFSSYEPFQVKSAYFGPKQAYKMARSKITGPKFILVLENIVIHLFKPKSQNLWSGFRNIAAQRCQSGQKGPKKAIKRP